jgi:hypothetical protein
MSQRTLVPNQVNLNPPRKPHLVDKLEYPEGTDMTSTAEQFIERGAATSSRSGKSYLVRCAGMVPMESGVWLEAELQQVRAARAASSPR